MDLFDYEANLEESVEEDFKENVSEEMEGSSYSTPRVAAHTRSRTQATSTPGTSSYRDIEVSVTTQYSVCVTKQVLFMLSLLKHRGIVCPLILLPR